MPVFVSCNIISNSRLTRTKGLIGGAEFSCCHGFDPADPKQDYTTVLLLKCDTTPYACVGLCCPVGYFLPHAYTTDISYTESKWNIH